MAFTSATSFFLALQTAGVGLTVPAGHAVQCGDFASLCRHCGPQVPCADKK